MHAHLQNKSTCVLCDVVWGFGLSTLFLGREAASLITLAREACRWPCVAVSCRCLTSGWRPSLKRQCGPKKRRVMFCRGLPAATRAASSAGSRWVKP